jgi:hypothetical protein
VHRIGVFVGDGLPVSGNRPNNDVKHLALTPIGFLELSIADFFQGNHGFAGITDDRILLAVEFHVGVCCIA